MTTADYIFIDKLVLITEGAVKNSNLLILEKDKVPWYEWRISHYHNQARKNPQDPTEMHNTSLHPLPSSCYTAPPVQRNANDHVQLNEDYKYYK